jgi:hypothetical protein
VVEGWEWIMAIEGSIRILSLERIWELNNGLSLC